MNRLNFRICSRNDASLKLVCMSVFRENLKEARVKAGLSQERLADAIPMPRPNYVGIETGRRPIPNWDTLGKIAAIQDLNVDIETLRAWWILDKADSVTIYKLFKILEPDVFQGFDKLNYKPTLPGIE